MRIISGKFKGKKILQPKDKETRPLKDLAKESIFNIINHSNKFKIDIDVDQKVEKVIVKIKKYLKRPWSIALARYHLLTFKTEAR